MEQATQQWEWGLSLLSALTASFTRPGWVRLVQGGTGMVPCWEELTLTRIFTVLSVDTRWRVLAPLAASGARDRDAVERQLLRLIDQEQCAP